MVFANHDSDYIQQLMVDNRLLSIDQMLFYEIALDMYKIHNKMLPNCFTELFASPSHRMITRSRNRLASECPRIQLTKQAITFKGTFIWNKIPYSVKYCSTDNTNVTTQFRSFQSFKDNLKDYILNTGPSQILHPIEY